MVNLRFAKIAGLRLLLACLGVFSCSEAAASDGYMLRHTTTGPLDWGFGYFGKVPVKSGASITEVARVKPADSLGKLFVAIQFYQSRVEDSFVLAKYKADGTVDTSYHNGGITTYNLPGYHEEVKGLVSDGSGRVVVLVSLRNTSTNVHSYRLVGFRGDGTLDPVFNILEEPGQARELVRDGTGSLYVLKDEPVVNPTPTGPSWRTFVRRYTSVGLPNESWNLAEVTGYPTSIAVDSRSRLLVAGKRLGPNGDAEVLRFTVLGLPDNDFGTGGAAQVAFDRRAPIGSDGMFLSGVLVTTDASNRPVLAGVIDVPEYARSVATEQFELMRLSERGIADPTFNGGQVVTTRFPGFENAAASDIAVVGSQIFVAGIAEVTMFSGQCALARYTSAGQLDNNFDTDGRIVTELSPILPTVSLRMTIDGLNKPVLHGLAAGTF